MVVFLTGAVVVVFFFTTFVLALVLCLVVVAAFFVVVVAAAGGWAVVWEVLVEAVVDAVVVMVCGSAESDAARQAETVRANRIGVRFIVMKSSCMKHAVRAGCTGRYSKERANRAQGTGQTPWIICQRNDPAIRTATTA